MPKTNLFIGVRILQDGDVVPDTTTSLRYVNKINCGPGEEKQ